MTIDFKMDYNVGDYVRVVPTKEMEERGAKRLGNEEWSFPSNAEGRNDVDFGMPEIVGHTFEVVEVDKYGDMRTNDNWWLSPYMVQHITKTDLINEAIDDLENKGDISDGSHTFDELYYHRMVLFSVICNTNKDIAWKSWKHSDGGMFENYFIVGVTTDQGDYSYHYHKAHWDEFDVKELHYAPEWDGHQPSDIGRLHTLVTKNNKKVNNFIKCIDKYCRMLYTWVVK